MSDTRALLDRISLFRQRLERTPHLLPTDASVAALAAHGPLLSHALRVMAGTNVGEGTLPKQLTVRTRRLLQEARGLVSLQRQLTDDPLMVGLATADPPDSLVEYHRETVAVTESALRMVQAFPESADAQVRLSEGVEGMLRAVRDRLIVARKALAVRQRDLERVDGLARRLIDLTNGRMMDLGWFAVVADGILEDARQAAPLRFPYADPLSVSAYPDSPSMPAPARFVAAHSVAVAQVVARVVAQDFEWSGRPVVPVVTALLMDVGMLQVPADILAKHGPLSSEERRRVEAHPAVGAALIREQIPEAGPLADAVAAHHERPDGTGYPSAIAGEAIPSLARLLSACDTYAALATDRPHRPAHDPRSALSETLRAAEQGRLDADFTEYLIQLSFHPVGTVVELSDGRVAVVAATHPGRTDLRATARPVVAVLTDTDRVVQPRPEFVDLAAAQRGGVTRALDRYERHTLLAKHYPELCG